MPRGYRYIICAVLGWLVLAAANDANPITERQQADAQQSIANSLANIASTNHDEAERARGSKDTEPCEPGDDRRYSDLCAQWKAADAARIAAWLSGASFFAVLIALILAYRANHIARDTARRQLRAYVGVKANGVTIDGTNVSLFVNMTNLGETPAYNVASCIHASTDKSANIISLLGQIAMPTAKDLTLQPTDSQAMIVNKGINIPAYVLAGITKGTHEIRVYGYVRYHDAFQVERRTSFAFLYRDGKLTGDSAILLNVGNFAS